MCFSLSFLQERESCCLESLYDLCLRNSIQINNTIVDESNLEELIKFEENDDYCIRYKHIKTLRKNENNERNKTLRRV